MNVSEIITKVKAAPSYVKEHWSTPAAGEYLSLKEMAAYTASQGGTYIFITASNIVTFSTAYFCGAIMEIPAMDFYMINLISTIIGYILLFINPANMLIYENHGRLSPGMKKFAHASYLGQIIAGLICYFIPANTFEGIMMGLPQIVGNILFLGGVTNYITWFIRRVFCAKYGRLKPFVVGCALPSAILISIIPYLPVQNLPHATKLTILHFAFTFMSFFFNNFNNVGGLISFMTPNSQERQKLFSIVPIITGLFPSIINLFFPILITLTGGYLNIKTYRVFVPIFAFIGAIIGMSALFCKERVIEEDIESRKKVEFFKGAKNALKNKYLWMINIANVFSQWHWLLNNLLSWWFVYSLRMEWFSGVAANIVVVGMTAGNLLCVFLTKHFQKRNVLLISRVATILSIFGVLLAIRTENIIIFLVATFLRNTIQPVDSGITQGINADVQIYHQWRFGERCDSISGIFTWFTNPLNMAVGYVVPFLLERVGFTSDWDVFFDSEIFSNVFSIHTWFAIIGYAIATIPFIFYNFTKEKHDMCVTELKQRLADSEAGTQQEEVVS